MIRLAIIGAAALLTLFAAAEMCGAAHAGGVQVCFADGSVRTLTATIDPANLYFLSTPASGDLPAGDF